MKNFRLFFILSLLCPSCVLAKIPIDTAKHAVPLFADTLVERWHHNQEFLFLLPLGHGVDVSLSSIYSHTDSTQLYNPFLGYKQSIQEFNVRGYVKSDNGRVAYGYARYQRGKTYGVRYNSMIATEDFYPYILGDSLSAKQAFEDYLIGGTLMQPLGDFYIGGTLGYQGAVYFRTQDPRLENRYSKIMAQLSGAYLSKRYVYGLSLAYAYERQNIDAYIRQATKRQQFFSFTGMGTYDHTYSLTSDAYSRNLYQHNYTLKASFYDKNKKGWNAEAGIHLSRSSAVDAQERIPFINYRRKPFLSVGYIYENGKHAVNTQIKLSHTWQRGIEQYYETVVLHTNPLIEGDVFLDSKPKFHRQTTALYYTLDYAYRVSDSWRCYASFQNQWINNHERFLYRQNQYLAHYGRWSQRAYAQLNYILPKLNAHLGSGISWTPYCVQSFQFPKGNKILSEIFKNYLLYGTSRTKSLDCEAGIEWSVSKKHRLSMILNYNKLWGAIDAQNCGVNLSYSF